MKIKDLDAKEEAAQRMATIKSLFKRWGLAVLLGASLGANVGLGIMYYFHANVIGLQNKVLQNAGILEKN